MPFCILGFVPRTTNSVNPSPMLARNVATSTEAMKQTSTSLRLRARRNGYEEDNNRNSGHVLAPDAGRADAGQRGSDFVPGSTGGICAIGRLLAPSSSSGVQQSLFSPSSLEDVPLTRHRENVPIDEFLSEHRFHAQRLKSVLQPN